MNSLYAAHNLKKQFWYYGVLPLLTVYLIGIFFASYHVSRTVNDCFITQSCSELDNKIAFFSSNIVKTIISLLLKVYKPKWLLKLDKYLEEKIGIDIIKQEKKWFEKHPLLLKRIEKLEKDSHAPCPLEEFDEYPALIKRIEKLENKVK